MSLRLIKQSIFLLIAASFLTSCGKVWGTVAFTEGSGSPVVLCDTSNTGFVQANSFQSSAVNPYTVNYLAPQTAGNTNIVVFGVDDITTTVTSVTDSSNNSYQLILGPTRSPSSETQYIYAATNIVAAPAGSNVVSVALSSGLSNAHVLITEYSGLNASSLVDISSPGTGNSGAYSTTPVTTTNACDLLIGGATLGGTWLKVGASYSVRSNSAGDMFEDRVVSSVASYTAPGTQTGGDYANQMVAFKKNLSVQSTAPPFVLVQGAANQPSVTVVQDTVTFIGNQLAGDTIIVVITWSTATGSVTAISDTANGAVYNPAGAAVAGASQTQYIYYASNINAAAAGTNVLTVHLSAARILAIQAYEYSGLNTASPFDVATGTFNAGSTNLNSGSVVTNFANELIIGAMAVGAGYGEFVALGPNFWPIGNITHSTYYVTSQRIVSSVGTYSATATEIAADPWIMQIATFH